MTELESKIIYALNKSLNDEDGETRWYKASRHLAVVLFLKELDGGMLFDPVSVLDILRDNPILGDTPDGLCICPSTTMTALNELRKVLRVASTQQHLLSMITSTEPSETVTFNKEIYFLLTELVFGDTQ